MELDTEENGSKVQISDKVKEYKLGQMVPCMRVGGKTTKLMVKADLSMLMEISMTVSGRMIRLTDLEFTLIWMELDMRVNGRKISNMGKVWKHGLMEQVIEEIT